MLEPSGRASCIGGRPKSVPPNDALKRGPSDGLMRQDWYILASPAAVGTKHVLSTLPALPRVTSR